MHSDACLQAALADVDPQVFLRTERPGGAVQVGVMSEAVFGIGPNNRHYTYKA